MDSAKTAACTAAGKLPGPTGQAELRRLATLLSRRHVVVLSGAGISTESGIPDYRGPNGSLRRRLPMQYREFVGSAEARSRYWARSCLGWPRMESREPNAAHRSVARLEAAGIVIGTITQNVDGLHQKSGTIRVVELHGALRRVRCLDCGRFEDRTRFQERMLAINPGWERPYAGMAPDGDVDMPVDLTGTFRVPPCQVCGGMQKPDIVFFGENVPAGRVQEAWDLLGAADVLLVLGSSLTVYSGYRFVERSARENRPVAIINQGPTRGDRLASLRIEGTLGEVLPELCRQLCLTT